MKHRRYLLFFALLGAFSPLAGADPLQKAHKLYFSGHPKEALALYKTHSSSEAALNGAFVAQELGRHQEAIEILEATVEQFPDNDRLQSELGWAMLNEGVFENLPNLDPLAMAQLELENGNLEASEEILLRLRKEKPKFTLSSYYLGHVLERQNKTEAAVESFKQSIINDSHFVEARPHLARLYEKQGDVDAAWRQYAKMSYVHRGNKKARRGLARLKDKITKKPEEILPPKVIEKPTDVPPLQNPEEVPKIRVGIGTTSSGKPTLKKKISFRTSDPFILLHGKTGRVLAKGTAHETWQIRLNKSRTEASLIDPQGKVQARFTGYVYIRQPEAKSPTTILNSLHYAPGTPWGGMADKELRGEIEIIVGRRTKRLLIINHVTMEEYVYGVLAAEMPSHWPLEALKSQAVIARNIAQFRKRSYRLHRKYAYDLCDEQHCQVYAGVRVENDKVRRAVDETRGEILTYNKKPAHTVFHSNCGGKTQTGIQVGWGHVPYWKAVDDGRNGTTFPKTPYEVKMYLKGTPDVFCQVSNHVWNPEYRWSRVVRAEDIADKLKRKRNVGRVRQIYILKRNASGHIQKIQIVGTKSWVTLVKEHHIRKYLGLGSQRSTKFVIETVVRDKKAHSFVFYGGGWGHSVGLCQSGAAGMADDKFTYKDILMHYYPGTKINLGTP